MHILKNFKNFADAQLNLLRPLTLMIGRNGSGKSNVIEAVELLAQLAHGRPLYEITDVGRGSGTTFEVRGGLAGCLKYDQARDGGIGSFSLGFEARWRDMFKYNITVNLTPQPKISNERLQWGSRTVFSAEPGKRDDILDVQFDNFRRGGKKPVTHLPSDRSVLSRYESFARLDNSAQKQKEALSLVRAVEQHLNAAFVFDLNPKLMRNYERIGQRLLVKDGSNLSSVLYGLKEGDKYQQAALVRILENLKQLPEEPFDSFEFVQTKLNDVLIGFRSEDQMFTDARLLSDGSLRALAILTALETVPEQSRIIIEEMDNGIHPSRAQMLINAIWECSKRRKLNVLATTHNPATLDSLSAEQRTSVVLCHYDLRTKGSRLTPLTELPRADVLLERGHLGDLVTHQVVEQYLSPDFDEEQRRKAKAWLESLA